MAATAPMKPSHIVENSFVKALAESSILNSVPSQFSFANDSKGFDSDSIPIVDFSLLASDDPDQRAKVLRDLDNACREWGFFVLINHGISDSLLKDIIEASLEYFELPKEDKRRYEAKSSSDPIKSGTRKLLQDIGENLELEEGYIDEALKLNSCFQLYAANYYPPCPQPDQAMGIPAHTDHGLLTFLIHNGVAGLQIEHNGEWFNTNSPQNSILVNTADHLEIFSNGRYKSVKHRAVVNKEATRISVVMANGAAPDAIVSPAGPLVERDGRAYYRPMKFIEYVETMLSNRFQGKSNLDCLKIQDDTELKTRC
ncbi:2-oxoglutarate-dependent dioxygenase 19 [Sesamum angolense]|uniref:2-oxoglutarate-dependent dioxygenase 19 n=1 Tax=Sesamum angolense TaxID=2727404 RepID=A0AAE2BXZ4_9LAMI|nr:2-oxoglutarate-dependent dioxygenase 19 [Sesamum angolense]